MFDFPAAAPGAWRIDTMIGESWQALLNPIFVGFPNGGLRPPLVPY